jgi:hypothetical protein
MKLKILPLLFLLTTLPTLTLYAQNISESRTVQKNDYGIEAGKSYPGSLVLKLLQAAEAEIDAASREAYEAGYKAALLEAALRAAYYQSLAESLRRELETERKKSTRNKITFGVAGFALGAIGMSVIYFIGNNPR